MVQPIMARSHKRVERKKIVLVVVLLMLVAGVSFFLGVKFGQNGGGVPGFAAEPEKPKLPMASKVAVPPPPAKEVAPEPAEKLTFYDNLPKGNQAPLGSGINLPPEAKSAETTAEKSKVVKQATIPVVAVAPAVAVPPTSPTGSFIVQIASFRTGEDAEKLAKRLHKYRLSAFVESADLGDKGVWYRVIAGPYVDREGAEQAVVLLKEQEKFSALVRQR